MRHDYQWSLSFDKSPPIRTKFSKISRSKCNLCHKSIHILNSAHSITASEGAVLIFLLKSVVYDTISSHVKISMISLMSRLSFKRYLNSLVYHRNIFGSSSEVFGNLRTSSEIFGKSSGAFAWPSEQFWKIFGNLRKVVGNLRKIIKNAVFI